MFSENLVWNEADDVLRIVFAFGYFLKIVKRKVSVDEAIYAFAVAGFVEHGAVSCHLCSANIDTFDVEFFNISDNDKVRPVAQLQTADAEFVMFNRVEKKDTVDVVNRDAHFHGAMVEFVNVAAGTDVVRVGVVGAGHDAVGVRHHEGL